MDKIIQDIEYDSNETNDPGLTKAKIIINRLRKRDLYKCAAYYLLNPSLFDKKIHYQTIRQNWLNEIYNIYKEKYKNNENLCKKDDIIVQLMSLGYGMESRNPLEQALVYNSQKPLNVKKITLDQITKLQSGDYKEIIFRVFVKNETFKKHVGLSVQEFVKNKQLIDSNNFISNSFSPKTRNHDKKTISTNNNDNNNISSKNILSKRNMDNTDIKFNTPPHNKKRKLDNLL